MSIDRTIAKYSGSANYMDQLAVITGHINTINEEYYTNQIMIVKKTYLSIIDKLNTYSKMTEKLKTFINVISKEYVNLNLDALYEDKEKIKTKKGTKKVKKIHKVRITPRDIYESKWFKLVSEIETLSADLIGRFNITGSKMTEEHLTTIKDENVLSTFTFYDIPVDNDEITSLIFICSKFLNRLIEILLTPMYDVKAYMNAHWMEKIDEVLGVELKGKIDGPITQEDVKNYVYSFVITKYRLELTSDTEEFAKSLIKTLDPLTVGGANPARFINLIDSIKMDEIEGSKGVKKMVGLAREELIKLSTKENIQPSEIINDINNILNCDVEEEDVKVEEQVEPDDVFN